MKIEMGMEIFNSCNGLTRGIVERIQQNAEGDGIQDGGFAIVYENIRNDKRLFGDVLPDEKMIRVFPFVEGEEFNDFEVGCCLVAGDDEDSEDEGFDELEDANFEIFKVYINDELYGEISVIFITEDEISEDMLDEILQAIIEEIGSCCKIQR